VEIGSFVAVVSTAAAALLFISSSSPSLVVCSKGVFSEVVDDADAVLLLGILLSISIDSFE